MSLVNDMLTDLEARSSRPTVMAEETLQAPVNAGASRWPFVLSAGALVMIASVFFYGQWFSPEAVSMPVATNGGVSTHAQEHNTDSIGEAEVTNHDVERSIKTAPKNTVADRTVEAVNFTAQRNAPGERSNGQQSTEASIAVEKLLHAADRALAENRLTRPPVSNAHALYRHVLLLQEGNLAAEAGIKKIQQRYEQLITSATETGDWQLAKDYMRRAQDVGMPANELENLRLAIEQAERELLETQAAQDATQGETETSSVAGEATEQGSAARNRTDQDNTIENSTAQPSPINSVASNTSTSNNHSHSQRTGTLEPSLQTRENNVMARARRLLSDGNPHEAIEILNVLVTANPQAQSAAFMLFDLYVQYGNLAEANAMQMRARIPESRHYFQARLLAHNGQNNSALQQLEQIDPAGSVRQPYLALQAALYQNNGQFVQAAELYRELVQMNKRESKYWLGLGVAAEALGLTGQALQAFTAADQLAPANPAVGQYIKQRIQVLSQ